MTESPKTLEEIVGAFPYPGRGLVVGTTLVVCRSNNVGGYGWPAEVPDLLR
jgi:hypothetical protein